MNEPPSDGWREADTATFLDQGRVFVPDREGQIETLCALIPATARPFGVLELCCGEGLLADAVLRRHPHASVRGLDGSPEMLRRARERLAAHGERFEAAEFDLTSRAWRTGAGSHRAVVSSLALHHLDAQQKRALFSDVLALLEPGGAFLVADLVEPVTREGRRLAAESWEEEVRRRSRALHGDERALDAFRRTRWNHFRYSDPADTPSPLVHQLDWLADAGFVDADVYWMKAGHAVFGALRAGGRSGV